MKFQIGLLDSSIGWRCLLKQIGVPFKTISENINAEDCSVIVVGDDFDTSSKSKIEQYASCGGSILFSSRAYHQLTGTEVKEKQISYIFPESASLFSAVGLLDIFSPCLIPSNANELKTLDGKQSCFVGKWNKANIIVLPFDAGKLFVDERNETKSFYSPHSTLPFERVSLVSKITIRQLVSTAIKHLHGKEEPSQSIQPVFAFRIDTDYANQTEIEKLYRLSQKYHIPFTWFVDVKSQENLLPYFAEMEHQEIGIHCYEHRTYDEFQPNYDNIQKAKQLFEKNNLDAKGFAAPFGKWNQESGRAVQKLGFEYSSEFSYDYDNLPSYPILCNEESTVLQVPIHPISIGTLKRLRYSDEEMIQYFQFAIEQKRNTGEPIILYHHPKDGHENVLESIFETVQRLEFHTVRFAEYVSMWKNRGELAWRTTLKQNVLPKDYLRIRKFNPWISFIRLQDFIFHKVQSKQ